MSSASSFQLLLVRQSNSDLALTPPNTCLQTNHCRPHVLDSSLQDNTGECGRGRRVSVGVLPSHVPNLLHMSCPATINPAVPRNEQRTLSCSGADALEDIIGKSWCYRLLRPRSIYRHSMPPSNMASLEILFLIITHNGIHKRQHERRKR